MNQNDFTLIIWLLLLIAIAVFISLQGCTEQPRPQEIELGATLTMFPMNYRLVDEDTLTIYWYSGTLLVYNDTMEVDTRFKGPQFPDDTLMGEIAYEW